jgi:hypothetical protein
MLYLLVICINKILTCLYFTFKTRIQTFFNNAGFTGYLHMGQNTILFDFATRFCCHVIPYFSIRNGRLLFIRLPQVAPQQRLLSVV